MKQPKPDDQEQLLAPLGIERFEATCTECGRTWKGTGTPNARRARRQAQAHTNRTRHLVEAQHANPR